MRKFNLHCNVQRAGQEECLTAGETAAGILLASQMQGTARAPPPGSPRSPDLCRRPFGTGVSGHPPRRWQRSCPRWRCTSRHSCAQASIRSAVCLHQNRHTRCQSQKRSARSSLRTGAWYRQASSSWSGVRAHSAAGARVNVHASLQMPLPLFGCGNAPVSAWALTSCWHCTRLSRSSSQRLLRHPRLSCRTQTFAVFFDRRPCHNYQIVSRSCLQGWIASVAATARTLTCDDE
jgi:hypothetical protein